MTQRNSLEKKTTQLALHLLVILVLVDTILSISVLQSCTMALKMETTNSISVGTSLQKSGGLQGGRNKGASPLDSTQTQTIDTNQIHRIKDQP